MIPAQDLLLLNGTNFGTYPQHLRIKTDAHVHQWRIYRRRKQNAATCKCLNNT